MRQAVVLPVIAILVGLTVAGAAAATTQAVQAAHAATRAARVITFHLSGGSGSVTLQRIGRTRTRIVLRVPPAARNESARLYRGRDCNDQRHLADSLVALAPINSAGSGAPVSQTIVSLPIERLTSDYVVDVRNRTSRSQVAAACAHLGA